MIKFEGKIVQFGFGAVGKSFYEKVSKEIKFGEKNYFVITRDSDEFHDYINLGGLVANFITCNITKENYQSTFTNYLNEGDILIDFADTVGTSDICDWCAQENIMYINTGVADWPENWLNIFEQDKIINDVIKKHRDSPLTNKHPIVLQHGNNPGLVSYFVKAGIEYIIRTQHKKDKQLKSLLVQNKFNQAAQILGIKIIHVNDVDLQKIAGDFNDNTLVNTWCVDTFLFEMLTEAAMNIGNHENIDYKDECKAIDLKNGFLEFKNIATEKKCRTYYPHGMFEGFLVPHEETITIAKSLEVKHNNQTVYRPSVMFVYAPCDLASNYLHKSKVNDYPIANPTKPADCEDQNGQTIIRGHVYPENEKIVYKESITSGTEYVGVLLLGENCDPVWIGNRIELSFLYKNQKNAYWQTPTITPVAISTLAATCWMIKNKDKGGFYFPDDIKEYKYILKMVEKYISKTLYKTFDRGTIEKELKVNFFNLQVKDTFVN